MKYLFLSTALLAGLSNSASANTEEPKDVDPSNLTRVTTAAALVAGSEGKKKLSGSMSGSYSNGVAYQGKLEAAFNGDNDYTSSRAQWFQAYKVDSTTAPMAGFSIDLNHQKSGDLELLTGGLGALTMVPTSISGLVVFPQLAAVAGDIELAEQSHTVYGGMGAFYFSQKLGDNGTYLQVWPEYTYLSGDNLSLETTKYNMAWGTPISKNKAWWTQVLLEYSSTKLSQTNMNIDSSTDDKSAWFFIRRYF